MRPRFCLACVLGLTLEAAAIAEPAPEELKPRRVTLHGMMAISDALAQITQQSGSAVEDRRKIKAIDKVGLQLKNATYWEALDAIAKATGNSLSPYEADGKIALVDRPRRARPTVYSGLFRVGLKQLSVTRDADADAKLSHLVTANLEVAWEPRFQPLLFSIAIVFAEYGKDQTGKVARARAEEQNMIAVPGRNAFEDLVRLEAPHRSSPKITSLKGELRVVGPVEMLSFASPVAMFAAKPLPMTTQPVTVTFHPLKVQSRGWVVDIEIDNGYELPKFESHQSWTANNRMRLERGKGQNAEVLEPRQVIEKRKPGGMYIRYEFPATAKAGQPGGWTAVCITPGRITEFTVPFDFKDLPLP